jgi:exodeoxyribonuclease VII large subunit
VYTLFELTKSLESVINKTYQRPYWIRAEIAKLNFYPKSGHCYPDLVEKENGITLAQMRATIWAGPFQAITAKFREVTREHLGDGMKILVLAHLSFHPTHGLTLQISDIDPSFSLGEMARERNEAIARLKKEGLFDLNHKLPFPMLPRRVAIISVETSKGYHDFMKVIGDNETGYQLFTMLFPALLQGTGAIVSIKQQLERIKKVARHFDVVIIIRGGGGDVGLSSFDHYSLAAAVATFPLPVITGIGHATNETVVELVAHSNKITPTEVAYFLLQHMQQFEQRVLQAQMSMIENVQVLLEDEGQLLSRLADRLSTRTSALIAGHQYRLNRSVLVLGKELKSGNFRQTLKLKGLLEKLENSVPMAIRHQLAELKNHQLHLSKSGQRQVVASTQKLNALEDKTRLLDPVNILKRGFSITFHDGKPVKSVAQLLVGDQVETQYFQGKTTSIIQNIEK